MAPSECEWSSLIGQTVELHRDGRLVRRGKVDAVTADSSIMWLQPDAPHGRQLITHADGYHVCIPECHD